ncbi:ExbD/TolR family protein [Stigmatella aurantiaca]|uniref:Biopolymer transport protein, ExbD/TolR family n=1 Tax=Stigmatella aurantiaca (strain DW4/3-1) TaxID=378806 RepID=Q09CP4_STIAD|nr:biopolymer transporter ExbD [Stigmatella aurantiaca]ADO70052.1 Biopolymer transport protein, ExbD/TolR family [Stigmatella aurantiaca DW4/3-1]EAU69556.1 TolR protein [Stigmatella aurantiaca DW4/3-1]
MAGHKQRQWVKPQSAPNSDINVTPLVDVVLVLLIIFMVVTPLLEKDIEVRVPETEVENTPPPENPDQLVVQLDEAGKIKINAEQMASQDDYVTRLKRMLAAKPKEERIVFFMATDKTNYGSLVTALDGAKAAGAFVLGMATEDLPQGAVVPGAEGDAAPVSPDAPAPPPAP